MAHFVISTNVFIAMSGFNCKKPKLADNHNAINILIYFKVEVSIIFFSLQNTQLKKSNDQRDCTDGLMTPLWHLC